MIKMTKSLILIKCAISNDQVIKFKDKKISQDAYDK